jgi:hypothetical protein
VQSETRTKDDRDLPVPRVQRGRHVRRTTTSVASSSQAAAATVYLSFRIGSQVDGPTRRYGELPIVVLELPIVVLTYSKVPDVTPNSGGANHLGDDADRLWGGALYHASPPSLVQLPSSSLIVTYQREELR